MCLAPSKHSASINHYHGNQFSFWNLYSWKWFYTLILQKHIFITITPSYIFHTKWIVPFTDFAKRKTKYNCVLNIWVDTKYDFNRCKVFSTIKESRGYRSQFKKRKCLSLYSLLVPPSPSLFLRSRLLTWTLCLELTCFLTSSNLYC